jgi:hypothetical protein
MPVKLSEIPQKLRMGLEAVMLDDASKTLRNERAHLSAYRAMMLTDQDGNPPPRPTHEGDDGMMIFGDANITVSGRESGNDRGIVQPPQEPKKSPLSGVVKAALVGLGVASGAGGVALLPVLSGLLNRSESPIVAPQDPLPPEVRIERHERDYRIGDIQILEDAPQ